MKATIFLLLLISAFTNIDAQYDQYFQIEHAPVDDNTYGEGGKVQTFDIGLKDKDGNIDPNLKGTVRFYVDPQGTIVEKVTVINQGNGRIVDSTVETPCGPFIVKEKYKTIKASGQKEFERSYINTKGEMTKGHRRIEKDGVTQYFNLDKNGNWIESNTVTSMNELNPMGNMSCCSFSKSEISGGYSYLSGQVGNDMVSFPLGADASFTYNFNNYFGVGADFSYHRRKKDYQTFSRSFILAKGQYNFGDPENCDRNFKVEAHLLCGVGLERVKFTAGSYSNTSRGSGLAFGAGVGGAYKISNSLRIKIQTDFIAVKFKNSDELNKNLRGNLVLVYDRPFRARLTQKVEF